MRDGAVAARATERTDRSHVGSLAALVAGVLEAAGVAAGALDGVAVSIGPGSFTGLRIGLGFAKGLVFGTRTRLVAVPTLEALAHVAEAPAGATVCAALDARKREVYAGLFRAGDATLERLAPDAALAPAALAERLPPGCILVGDAPDAYPVLKRADVVVRPFATHPPRGDVVARLGSQRLAAGEAADPGPLVPAYLRPPEAQLPRGPR